MISSGFRGRTAEFTRQTLCRINDISLILFVRACTLVIIQVGEEGEKREDSAMLASLLTTYNKVDPWWRCTWYMFPSSLFKLCQQLRQHYATSRFSFIHHYVFVRLRTTSFLLSLHQECREPCFQLSLCSTYSFFFWHVSCYRERKNMGRHKFVRNYKNLTETGGWD